MEAYIGVFVLFYFLAVVTLSLVANKRAKSKSTGDFYVASNSLGTVLIFATAFATAFSSFAFMGQMGQVYNLGASAIFNFMTYTFFFYPIALVIGKRIWFFGKKYGYITPADLLAHRYQCNAPIRLIMGLLICVYCSIFYIVIQINGTSWALETATGIDPVISRLLICIVMAIYINIGGARGAAYVDFMQFCFIMIGIVIIAITAIAVNGGFSSLYIRLDQVNPAAFLPKQPFQTMLSGSIVMTISNCVWPTIWMKYYAAKNVKSNWAVAAGIGSGTVVVTVGMPLIILAGLMIAYPMADAATTDTLVIRYVLDYTHPAVATIVVGGLVCAAMSTAAGLTLLCSSVFTKDLPKCLPKETQSKISDHQLLYFGKLIAVLAIFVCFLISLRPMGALVTAGITLTYPGYFLAFPLVVGGFFWKKANKYGAVSGLLLGFITVMITTYVVRNPFGIATGIWGVAVCTLTFITVSLCTAQTDQKTLEQFGLSDEQIRKRKGLPLLASAKQLQTGFTERTDEVRS